MKGFFIVIDGTDGSGKATQSKLLSEYFIKEGHNTLLIDFPQYQNNHMGRLIKECLTGKRGDFLSIDPKIASVLYAVDRFESSTYIKEHIAKGGIVIADRFVSANQIHQGAKIKDDGERIEFLTWLDHLEYGILGLPRPHIVLYLNVPPTISQKLAEKRAEEKGQTVDIAESNTQHQERATESALKIVAENNNWKKIECSKDGEMKSREEIHDEIIRVVIEAMSAYENKN